jgi:hypothetical protein
MVQESVRLLFSAWRDTRPGFLARDDFGMVWVHICEESIKYAGVTEARGL